MSQQLINLNPDLKKLRDEGIEVAVREAFLYISNVPYLNSNREIKYGTLVSELTLSGNKTVKPNNHVIYFIGEFPCEKDGSPIHQIKHISQDQRLTSGLVVNHSFSNKPRTGYSNYYEKVIRYIEIISNPAKSVDDSVSEKTFKVIEPEDENSVFNYLDTHSSRAEISFISDKLKNQKIGIIGLGGTGSYILDLVAKTPVQEIHLFDGDRFLQHNAFRSPGAPSVDELIGAPYKTEYFKGIYSKMHKNIVSHQDYINATNIERLLGVNFVFVCIDKGDVKELLFEYFEKNNISFIDVGMGVHIIEDMLIGVVRTTSSTEKMRAHIKDRVSFSEGAENEYSKNIQIADLNSLNASLAVIKWKKLCGFYQDLENENNSTYTLNVNMLLSEDNNA